MKKRILALSGSLRHNSSNGRILELLASTYPSMEFDLHPDLSALPHFHPDKAENPPAVVVEFCKRIAESDGVIICTPEYVFSVPAVLKNALEWTVATTVFTDKPLALIVASGVGEKTFESLILILKTLGVRLGEHTTLLIQGARSKLNQAGKFSDEETTKSVDLLMNSFRQLLDLYQNQ